MRHSSPTDPELYQLLTKLAELEREEDYAFQVAKRAYVRLASSRRQIAAVKKEIESLEARERAKRKNIAWQSALSLDPDQL